MKLYMFEHCSLCFRVRMIAALKRLHLQETVVLDDDSGTMIGLVGRRVVPILVKDDGQPMLESMDMVRYIDGLGEPVLTGIERPEIAVHHRGDDEDRHDAPRTRENRAQDGEQDLPNEPSALGEHVEEAEKNSNACGDQAPSDDEVKP